MCNIANFHNIAQFNSITDPQSLPDLEQTMFDLQTLQRHDLTRLQRESVVILANF